MQAIIVRWCDLIGVTNEGSIQVATGVVSGGAALFVAYAAFNSCSARSVEGPALKASGTCASSLPQRVDVFLTFFGVRRC